MRTFDWAEVMRGAQSELCTALEPSPWGKRSCVSIVDPDEMRFVAFLRSIRYRVPRICEESVMVEDKWLMRARGETLILSRRIIVWSPNLEIL